MLYANSLVPKKENERKKQRKEVDISKSTGVLPIYRKFSYQPLSTKLSFK